MISHWSKKNNFNYSFKLLDHAGKVVVLGKCYLLLLLLESSPCPNITLEQLLPWFLSPNMCISLHRICISYTIYSSWWLMTDSHAEIEWTQQKHISHEQQKTLGSNVHFGILEHRQGNCIETASHAIKLHHYLLFVIISPHLLFSIITNQRKTRTLQFILR